MGARLREDPRLTDSLADRRKKSPLKAGFFIDVVFSLSE